MADQSTDDNGVPLDDNMDAPGSDPGSSNGAPDPLLDEQPSGALSSVPKAGTKEDAQARLERSRANMDSLGKIYAADSGQLSDAYAQQKKTIQDATQRLLSMNFGASPQEEAYRRASVEGEPGTGQYDPGAHNAVNADILAQRRAAELQKQQLLAQYGMQGAQAQIGQSTANLNRDIQLQRIGQSDVVNASNLASKYTNQVPKISATGVKTTVNPDGSMTTQIDPVAQQAAADAAKQKLNNSVALKKATMNIQSGMMDAPTINFWADWATQNGGKLPPNISRMPGVVGPIMAKVAQDAQSKGDNAMSIIANGQLNQAQNAVLQDYTHGKTFQALQGLNTAIGHINVLRPLIDQLGNGDNTVFNRIGNSWDKNFMGATAPQSFDAVKSFVGGEIGKAVLPGGGGERERDEIAQAAAQASNPQALKEVLDKWQELLASKTNSAKFAWDATTQGKYGDFTSRFLMPATQNALGIKAPAALPAPRPGQSQAPRAIDDPLVQQYLKLGQQAQ